MKTYSKIVTVTEDDLDDLGHVNNVKYVGWIQDIAKEHWQSAAEQKQLAQFIWVVRNHNITYYAAAMLGDAVEVKTQIKESRASLSVREVHMRNERTNETILKSETQWCLVNPETMKPIRIPEAINAIFLD